ncbi:polyphenol oxidase family protein [Pantoea sp. Nvir]|uniref:polyphenol oxidase family protein n=1 Tax=Pantoea sp. Nvir TaxID=2576760 RepID=UPI0027F9A6F4|nr:polyphenol oxidase family protein [Pantoea sp. Nvir]CAJ0990831.1 hypothetical protein NVIRPANT_00083 [Pantoea sp. Nvir]
MKFHAHIRSTLLDALKWVEYAFQTTGEKPPAGAFYGLQRHSPIVVYDDDANTLPKSRASDGIIGLCIRPVAVYTADCLPVLIADTQHQHVAAVHVGLQGALEGVLDRTVERLCIEGASPMHLHIAIGPAIAPCCYEISAKKLAQITHMMPILLKHCCWHYKQPYNPLAVRAQAHATQNSIWFDLPQMATEILKQVGVRSTNIENIGLCTYCMAEIGSSYRRNTHFNNGYQSFYSWIRRCNA